MLTIEIFLTRFAEFTLLEIAPFFNNILATYPCYYGKSYGTDICINETVLQLVAHLIYLEMNTTDQGYRLTGSQSVGSVSVSYLGVRSTGDLSGNDTFFSLSKYGQRYLQLVRTNIGAIFS